MAHASQEFVLVGYSEDLERRPLMFVAPIPTAIICSACGNVPRLTLSLLCGHILCQPCYQSCATTSQCVCPLDGDVSVLADVTSKKYPAENLLRRKVHCWNKINGCGVVLPASQLAEHVRHDCQYHVTHCPTCSAAVRNRDVCAHLRSECTALVLHVAPEAQQGTDNRENTHLMAFEKKIEQRVGELDAKLARLALESASQSDKQVEICHHINHLKEALTQQLRTVSVQTLDRLERNEAAMKHALVASEKTTEQRVGELDTKLSELCSESGSQSDKLIELCSNISHLKEASDRNVAEIKALYSEQRESLTTAITSVLKPVPSDTKTHQQVIKGYAALKEEALTTGGSRRMSDKVYLRRYLLSWGIYFRKDGNSVNLYLGFQLHEGREDDFLDWPFTKELKLSIIHPGTREERLLRQTLDPTGKYRKFYSRPIEASNTLVHFPVTKVESSDIEGDGYVKRDQLLVRFEVLS